MKAFFKRAFEKLTGLTPQKKLRYIIVAVFASTVAVSFVIFAGAGRRESSAIYEPRDTGASGGTVIEIESEIIIDLGTDKAYGDNKA